MADLLAHVPPVRGGERRIVAAPGVDATTRDLRWHAHAARGTVCTALLLCWLAISWLNVAALDRTSWPIPVLMAAVLLWWITGVYGWLSHSTPMGEAMAVAVGRGMGTWRALPQPDRERARRVAVGLAAAGQRHDVDGVRLRLALLTRAAHTANAALDWRDDVDELTAWIDSADEVRGPQ